MQQPIFMNKCITEYKCKKEYLPLASTAAA